MRATPELFLNRNDYLFTVNIFYSLNLRIKAFLDHQEEKEY